MAAETSDSQTWDLDSLMPHPESEAFREAYEQFGRDLGELAERSEQLPRVDGEASHIGAWVKFLKVYQFVSGRADDLKSFIGCHAAADAGNKTFQWYEAQLSALDPLKKRIATNVEFALRDADDEDLAQFIEGDPWLGEIAFFLSECQRNAKMRLPRAEELLAAELAVDGIHAWGRLYDRLSGELRIEVMERGEVVEKSPSQVQFDSPERSVRQNNFFASSKAWRTIADTCADALNHISGTRLTIYRNLGLADHLESPLRENRMQRATLETMWSTISDRKHVLLKYLDAKAGLLGLEKPAWYDVHAPLGLVDTPAAGARLSYREACALVIKTFDGFSGEFGEFARRAINAGWVESENRGGKRQGGFCTGFPTKQQSRIFMTFTESPDSMLTLAHELGHAFHSHVLRDRPLFLQDYPMNLAETASTFAEEVVGEQRLRTARSQAEELSILDTMLSDAVVFLMNIHARFLFEDSFHKERANGELAASRFSELMLAAQKEAYLDSLADDGWYPDFWISKLHFYISELPFYNFPYTFGYLLSLGVHSLAGDGAVDDFPARYRELLVATGCRQTEDAVRQTLGDDLTDPAFWNRSLDIVEKRVERYLELAASVTG